MMVSKFGISFSRKTEFSSGSMEKTSGVYIIYEWYHVDLILNQPWQFPDATHRYTLGMSRRCENHVKVTQHTLEISEKMIFFVGPPPKKIFDLPPADALSIRLYFSKGCVSFDMKLTLCPS